MISVRASLLAATILAAAPAFAADLPARKAPNFAAPESFSHWQMRLRALAVTSAKRWSGLPEVPATGEIIPGFVYEAAWHGIFAPARTPRAIVMRWQSEVAKAIRVPKMRELLENGGYVPLADLEGVA